MIPILLTCYNRLEFTKRAFHALTKVHNATIYVIDNGSTDGTVEFLKRQIGIPFLILNLTNLGVAGAMNQFLRATKNHKIVGKCDNDTILPRDFVDRMLPHLRYADIVQAKHPLLKETCPGGFDAFVEPMRKQGSLRFNHFVGGSGILFRRDLITDAIPETEWALGGWRHYQREHPELRKAFATDVEIELLDTNANGKAYPKEYADYYKETKRI